MKLPILIFGLVFAVMPAFAEETQKVVERKTCEQIKAEIAELSDVTNLTANQQEELNQLKLQQRTSCGFKGGGRRTVSRPPVATTATTVKSDALTEYMDAKKANCEKLNAEIEKLVPNTDSVEVMQEMQRVYDMDCTERQMPEMAPANDAPAMPNKTPEEIAAEFDANLAAGLCGDGTKPNRYGCCTDETFKDLGNSVFACCPKTGGDCFRPLK